tara:strand:+ start:2534 stop:3334 length:801 start_codon:yes stop_codon:yes gene_type:complete
VKASKENKVLLFGDNLYNYANYRPNYPEALFASIVGSLSGTTKTCIDVGAGTGIASSVYANTFDHVIAVEPDVLMADSILNNPNLKNNVSVIKGDFGEVKNEWNTIDLINCSSSFHWLEEDSFLKKAKDLLRKEGLICVNNVNIHPVFNGRLNDYIQEEFNAVWKNFMNEKLYDLINKDLVVEKLKSVAGFTSPETKSFNNLKKISGADLIGFISSLSYFNTFLKSLESEGRKSYLSDFLERVEKFSDDGLHLVNFEVHLFLIKKL